ncbi:hypothetical protein PAPYR_4516 [Paratrimastix pyriformis]|uniref:Uncharacterized protein n=1 Tax=Paratrimastix pyriformis TaxID=342808 RepID=A0ABQ8UMF9_9EUKA|nr:hypothetical protein PAPYR_4516 [Paratrimastix pyriformis]
MELAAERKELEVVRRSERDQAVRLASTEARLTSSRARYSALRSLTPRSRTPPGSSPRSSPRLSPIESFLKPGEKGYHEPTTSPFVLETKHSVESTAFENLCAHLLNNALASPRSNPYAPYPTTRTHLARTFYDPDDPETALRPDFLALVFFREGTTVLDIAQPAPPLPSLPVLSSPPPDGPRPMCATPPTGVLRPNPVHAKKLSPHAIAMMAPAPTPLAATATNPTSAPPTSPTAPASASASEAAACQNSYVVGEFTLDAATIPEKVFQVARGVKAIICHKTHVYYSPYEEVPLSDLIAYCVVVVRGPLNDEERLLFHVTALTRGMGAYLEAGRFRLFHNPPPPKEGQVQLLLVEEHLSPFPAPRLPPPEFS